MSAIKKFFEKTKLELKFKKAGEGHKLNAPGTSGLNRGPERTKQNERKDPGVLTEEKKMAAEAAMARFTQKKGLSFYCL